MVFDRQFRHSCFYDNQLTFLKRSKWRWIGHTLRKPNASICKQALEWTPAGKRKKERPKTTWRRSVLNEAEAADKTWSQIKVLARKRNDFRNFVEALCSTRNYRNWVKSRAFLIGEKGSLRCTEVAVEVRCSIINARQGIVVHQNKVIWKWEWKNKIFKVIFDGCSKDALIHSKFSLFTRCVCDCECFDIIGNIKKVTFAWAWYMRAKEAKSTSAFLFLSRLPFTAERLSNFLPFITFLSYNIHRILLGHPSTFSGFCHCFYCLRPFFFADSCHTAYQSNPIFENLAYTSPFC